MEYHVTKFVAIQPALVRAYITIGNVIETEIVIPLNDVMEWSTTTVEGKHVTDAVNLTKLHTFIMNKLNDLVPTLNRTNLLMQQLEVINQ